MDDDDDANLNVVNTGADRGTTATFDYNDSAQSFIVANDFGTIDMDESSIGDEWNSGEELTVTLRDQDLNKNTGSDEDLTMALSDLIPSIKIGSPMMIETPLTGDSTVDGMANATKLAFSNVRVVDEFSGASTGDNAATALSINMGIPVSTLISAMSNSTTGVVYTFINYDVSSLATTVTAIDIRTTENVDVAGDTITIDGDSSRGLFEIHGNLTSDSPTHDIVINFTTGAVDITEIR